jgi:hypothetical protein
MGMMLRFCRHWGVGCGKVHDDEITGVMMRSYGQRGMIRYEDDEREREGDVGGRELEAFGVWNTQNKV